jgi:hypothetical protein
MYMARRAVSERNRGRVWRAAAGVSLIAIGSYGVTGAIAHADEPPVSPDTTAATGEMDGAVVAVGLPPVPPTSVEVAVGEPPVPPTSVVVAVGEPPVPPTSVVVAVGEPPVPPVTIPDAQPVVESEPVAAAPPASNAQPAAPQSVDAQLPETGPSATTATAIVASAAASVGVALRALAKR